MRKNQKKGLHKNPHGIRPIVSGCSGPTKCVSSFLDLWYPPQDERTEPCLDAIDAAEASHIPRDVIRQLFEIVFKCNVFSFDGKIYEQIQGTAMGTKMALSYANLLMDRFERAFLAQEPIQPLVWKHYIDDIQCIWVGTRSELEGFLNKAHRTLKLT